MLLMALLTGCLDEEADCGPVEPLRLSLGFYETSVNGLVTTKDTSFVSVYAEGTNAELRNRRIDNIFYLPVPAKGGVVTYVFEQESSRATLTLNYAVEAYFEDTACPPKVRVKAITLMPEQTTFSQNKIRINENAVSIFIP